VNKPIPEIEHPRDAIVRVTRACICGSDLHLYHGLMPDTRVGHTFGHEFVGIVEEVGRTWRTSRWAIACSCRSTSSAASAISAARACFSNCHNVNPNATAVGGIYGYSHTTGGYDGGQAEYVRVPCADVGPMIIPDTIDDDNAALCTDAYPTGYQPPRWPKLNRATASWCFGAGPVACSPRAARGSWARAVCSSSTNTTIALSSRGASRNARRSISATVADPVWYLKRESDWLG
jgi:threonine dehydrogenase-like Zn-dependent dehydrogenase